MNSPECAFDAPMTPSANGHYVSMVAHTAAYAAPFETRHDPHCPRSEGLAQWWESLMFMTTAVRVRSSWVSSTLECLVLWSTSPTRCPSTGIGRRRRRMRRLHERIPSPRPKNNVTAATPAVLHLLKLLGS